jgi:DNA-binding helix-hairpin-helix protein with protein kinase domain
MTNHVLRSGQKLTLGRKLGEGGEGAVYEVNGQPTFVAKIYGKPLDPKHAEKLEVVCALRTDKLSNVCAWPIEAIYVNGKACGFVMPLVKKATEIHELFGSAGRKRLFPYADWAFLIHVAKNLAAAVHILHAANIVVGDFNQRNIVVSEDATVKLWDCDSFQVERNGRIHYCTVGVPEFTAPELQSCTSFDGLKRSPQHDRFSLAVMIFYLLFLGRHPFSGDPTDPRVNSFELQDAIASRKFAYSPNAPRFGVQPPKISPPVRELGLELMPFFVKAFETSDRPSSADWFEILTKLEKDLSRCSFNPGHVFPSRLKTCPWCSYETQWSITTFLPNACPPRFVKAFDYAGLIASVKHCFQDIQIVIPPEPTNFRGRPLPPIFNVPAELSSDLNLTKSRLAQWAAEIVKLNELRQPDRQIAEIIKRGQLAFRQHKSVKDKGEVVSANATKAAQKLEQIQGQIALLEQRPVVRRLSRSLALSAIVCVPVYFASTSPMLGFASAFGTSAMTYLCGRVYRKLRLKTLMRTLSQLTVKTKQFEAESKQLASQRLTLQSQLNELSTVLKSLRKTDSDRIAKVDLLLVEAQRSMELAKADLLIKQSVFDEAQAKQNRSMEQRRQEYERRANVMRTLEAQRAQIADRLTGLSCPNALSDCRRQFTDAKNEYDRVQGLFLKELDLIRRSSRDRQMTEHLENFSIEKAKLGSGLLIALKSHGIETAADVNWKAVHDVRGFGDTRTANLVAWRDQLETIFVFDSSRQLSQQDRDSARLKYSADFQKAETFLKRATEQLRLAYESAKQQVLKFERELAIVNENLGQSRADVLETP